MDFVDNLKKGIRPNPSGKIGAGNGVRTRDPKLGKLVLYQLSYARVCILAPFPIQHNQIEEVNKTYPLLPQFKKLTHAQLMSRNIYSIHLNISGGP